MPMFDDLRLTFGSLILPEWYDLLVEKLGTIAFKGAVDYYGYVRRDILPEWDAILNLGSEGLKWNEIWASTAYAYRLVAQEMVFLDIFARNVSISGYLSTYAVASNLMPSADAVLNLGAANLRWNELWGTKGYIDALTSTDLSTTYLAAVRAKVTDYLVAESDASIGGYLSVYRLATSLLPEADMLLNLGSEGLRWNEAWVGWAYVGELFVTGFSPGIGSVTQRILQLERRVSRLERALESVLERIT